MLRVECESCKAPYQVDERRIPATGLKMRCPKCGHTFVVKAGAGEPVPPPDPHSRPSPNSPAPAPTATTNNRKMQATMLGVGSGISKPPGAVPAAPAAAPAPAPTPAAPPVAKTPAQEQVTPSDSEVGLPAARPIAAKPAKPPVPTPRKPAPSSPDLSPSASMKAGDADLPAARDAAKADLPATRPQPSKHGLPPAPRRPAPSKPDLGPEADLPAPAAKSEPGLPMAKPAAPKPPPPPVPKKPEAPPPNAAFEIDLPTSRNGAPAAAPSPAPAPAAAKPESMDAFGELDLPSLGASSNLPTVATGNNLPAVAANLPAVASALPAVASALPTVASALPSVAESLPTAANILPSLGDVLPTASDRPAVETKGSAQAAPPDLGLGDFGELDLPPGPAPAKADPLMPDMGSFGEFDLPPPPPLEPTSGAMKAAAPAPAAAAAPPPPRPSSPSADNLSFGEVDLGTSEGGAAIEAEAPLPTEANVPEARGADEQALPSSATNKPRTRTNEPKKSSKGRRIAVGVLALLALAGGALELTPFGAYGRHTIVDMMRARDYARRADEVAAQTRKKLASDIFPEARQAAEQAASARNEMPRARSLTAYAAVAELETQIRFGSTAERVPRVKQWLAELAQHPDTKYLNVALAAQDANNGDVEKARKGLDAASKRDVGDPIQEDIAIMRGEVELRGRDSKAALDAFAKASTMAKTARAEFGKARALVLARDLEGAKKSLAETLKLSPKHVEARIVRATLAWDAKDEPAALADLASVLEGDAKSSASDAARAQAHALRGWIHVTRGRSAEARAAFDEALKLDGRNVRALAGQGEVLFNEGRFTEALTRFDTAAQTDPNSVLAIVSAAKAKLSLERLQDAKTQLAAARAKFPKDWRVAYWLGKAEHSLGNKPVAEKELVAAVELLDAQDPDAVAPYVALSMLYASQGKNKEADQKLAEAKAKLPDSASLRRALGDMAAQRGDYDAAVQNFRASLEKDGNDLSTRFRLGVTLRRMRKIPEATGEFDKIVSVDKDYPGLSLERGLLFEEAGEVDKALEQFQGALAKAPDDPDLQLRVAAMYTTIGRPGDAIPILKKVIEKRVQSAEAQHYMGRALFLQGGPGQSEAMRFLKRAVELDPNRAEYHLYVGWAANNAIPAQLGLARDAIEKALALDKLLADAYWQRGVVGRKEGAVEDAIKDLKKALELKPSRVDAHAALAECYEDKNDTAAAMAEWQKAISADATKPQWRYRFGKMLFERGNVGEAKKHVVFAADEAEKLDPKPGWLASAEFLAGEVQRKTGNKVDAIERYRKFLDIAPTNSPDRKEAINALADMGVSTKPR